VEICELVIRDNELAVGDNEVALPEVAEGGTCVGRTIEVTQIGSGTTPDDGIGAIYVEERNGTSEESGNA
jgi:hypothetical protein